MYVTIYETGLISFDATLLFQIINILILVFLIVGIPVIIFKVIKIIRTRNKHLKDINQKLDLLIKESNNGDSD